MPSSSEVISSWQEAVEHTRSRSPASFEQWFSSVQFDQLDDGILQLTARDGFVRDWVKAHFLPDLVTQLDKLLGHDGSDGIRVEWRIRSDLENPVCAAKVTRSVPPPSRTISASPPVMRVRRSPCS